MRVYNKYFCLVALVLLVVLAGASGIARADGLVANWPFNGPSGSTSFADASGNGNTGTLVGTDTVTSVPAPIGTGLYFNGLSGTGNYISVPYNAAMSGVNMNTDHQRMGLHPHSGPYQFVSEGGDFQPLQPKRRKPVLRVRFWRCSRVVDI